MAFANGKLTAKNEKFLTTGRKKIGLPYFYLP